MGITLIAVLLALACGGHSARILALVPFPGRSHWMVIEPLLQELAARGHELTVFSTFPQKTPLDNYTDVDFSERIPNNMAIPIDRIRENMKNVIKIQFRIRESHENVCKLLSEPEFQKLIHSNEHYDLVITELYGSECFSYFAYKFKAPLIQFTASVSNPWAAERYGLSDNPSYIPNYHVSYSTDMSLLQRTYNTLVVVIAKYLHLNVFSKTTQQLTEQYFKTSLPPVNDVIANASLLFVNSYHALAQSRPFPPNVVEVGGIHIKKRQPLPEDLKIVLNKATNGVIIMSFGSVVRMSTIPENIIRMFINAFAKIPQTVIFKYDYELADIPPNVIIRKWLPQRDMMEHGNVVAIITHGGLGSTIESVYFGKPIIGVPLFADQYGNIKSVVGKGAGLQLDFETITEENVSDALKEILGNPKYKENMRRLSQQFRDRPMTALQTAVYWTEYVIRHQGAPHLRPASVDLPLYQYLLLDVVAVLSLPLLPIFYLVYFLFFRAVETIYPTTETSITPSHFVL